MNIQKLMQEAKKMQDNMNKKIQEFENQVFEYNYKNTITLKVKGSFQIVSINIDKTLVDPDDKTILEEMVAEAVNEAISDLVNKKDNITKSIIPNMPGFM